MRRKLCAVILALGFQTPSPARAQDHAEAAGYLASPVETPFGTVCTDNYGAALYLLDPSGLRVLLAGPGVGTYFSVSPDRTLVGLKQVRADGLQAPVVLDLRTGALGALHPPVRRAGQVSFTADGRTAFTIGDSLVLAGRGERRSYHVGTYANLAPVSPDGRRAVINDDGDRLWLLDLARGSRRCISRGRAAMFRPVWSPDGAYVACSGLAGTVAVYDVARDELHELGPGASPAWSPDGRTLVFSSKTIGEMRLLDADVVTVPAGDWQGRAVLQTPGTVELDPSFALAGDQVLFQTYDRREIRRRALDGASAAAPAQVVAAAPAALVIRPGPGMAPPAQAATMLDLPYVHQLYDTPDWFNGHWACAPSQAMMVLAYHRVLPRWPGFFSTPTPHAHDWGNYVSERYRFRQNDYAASANDPNGRPAQGGYGWMWSTGSPHTRMADFYRQHGLAATQTENTAYATAFAEVTAGQPFSMCVMLTSSGHLVAAHGVGAEPHTFVFNDPYGNKNEGYWNYRGKNVLYDWPGYNNGYQNLNGVAWCIATRWNETAAVDTLVDDLQFDRGFVLNTAPPASMLAYRDALKGFREHMWWTTTKQGVDTCYAEWRPSLRSDGYYEISAYVPFSNATAAVYRVRTADGEQEVTIDQKVAPDSSWVSLGVFRCQAGGGGSVRLGDSSPHPGQEIVFDAMRWSYRGQDITSVGREGLPGAFGLEQNWPNPFNAGTRIGFRVPGPAGRDVRLAVVDLLGREVAVLLQERKPPGRHEVGWDAAAMPSGVYLCRLTAGSETSAIKIVVLR